MLANSTSRLTGAITALCMILAFAAPTPSDAFPTIFQRGTTIYDPAKADNGYTIYTISGKKNNSVLLVDMEGNLVHYWKPDGLRITYAEPMATWNLLAIFEEWDADGMIHNGLVELDWDANVIWKYSHPLGARYFHHDFHRLPNGNTLMLAATRRIVPEISDETILDDHIIEVSPAGEIVWEWYTSDHYLQLGLDTEAKSLIADHAGDWSHTNSIQALPFTLPGDDRFLRGNILVSQRHTNIIFLIDKETGDIVWRLGPKNSLAVGQHAPNMISSQLPGAGNILLFDNGGSAGYPPEYRFHSRLVELDPRTNNISWHYVAGHSGMMPETFFSFFGSNAQRLPNGNTFAVEADNGRFFEVTPEGELVWEYVNPFEWVAANGITLRDIYRAWRVPADWPRLR